MNCTFTEIMRKLIYLLVLIILLPLFEGCLKKAKEDPFLSMRSRKNRIKGQWTITKYLIDGEDYLHQVFDTAYYEAACQSDRVYHEELAYSGYFSFDKSGEFAYFLLLNATYSDHYASTIYCNNDDGIFDIEDLYQGDWDFTVGKKELVINYDDGYYSFYSIDKLSNKELWLSRKTNHVNVVMEFVRKEE